MYDRIMMAEAAADALRADNLELPDWLEIEKTLNGSVDLPRRLVHVRGSDRHTIELAVAHDATMTFFEGKALLEKVKLSFIKSMSTVALIVQAYQTGCIKSAKPLLIALERKGHEMPPPEQMEALMQALGELE
jgi:predicted nucleic acid-binding protein